MHRYHPAWTILAGCLALGFIIWLNASLSWEGFLGWGIRHIHSRLMIFW